MKMKKMLLVACLLLPLVATSQSARYGITVGVMPTTTASEPHYFTPTRTPEGFTSNTTYNVGVTAIFSLGNGFSLNPALKCTNKSVSTTWQGVADGDVSATLHFTHLSFVPRVQHNPFGGLMVGAGPVVDVNLSSSETVVGDWGPGPYPIPYTKHFRFGTLFSVGYLLEVGDRILILPELSYDLGLTNTNDIYGGRYSSTELAVSILMK